MTRNLFQNFNQDSHWMPVSDMLAGLMMVFLLLAVSQLDSVSKQVATLKKNEDILCGKIQVSFIAIGVDIYKKLSCDDGILVSFDNVGDYKSEQVALPKELKKNLDKVIPSLIPDYSSGDSKKMGKNT